jgi:hypothetical protein
VNRSADNDVENCSDWRDLEGAVGGGEGGADDEHDLLQQLQHMFNTSGENPWDDAYRDLPPTLGLDLRVPDVAVG